MKFLKFLLYVALIIGGFFLGTSWQSKITPPDTTPQVTADSEENPQNTQETIPANFNTSPTMPPGLNEEEKSTIRLFENSAPSVAYITTSRLRQDYWTRNVMEIPQGSGSGFVWDSDGHIITNYHVIQGADRAQVTLADQTTWDAELVGKAPEKDLAVLKITAPRKALQPIPVGVSSNLMVGQSVFAIGNPFGLDQTLTTGIISALGREIQSVAGIPIRGAIQTDAAINPGNSGGPLLNSSGQLIGVNTAIYSPSGASAGIGFSIPVDVVKWVVPELIIHGKIMRPTLGVELATDQTTARLNLSGALILDVIKGSGAEQAGLQPTYRDRNGRIRLGDAIVAINGDKVESGKDLVLILEKYKPGDVVKVKLLRSDEEVEVDLILDEAR
ncbi:MAG: trypsin-like peptidase domain-containing protein [Saprospiraceae bacterium]